MTQVSTKFWADYLKRGCYWKQLGFLFACFSNPMGVSLPSAFGESIWCPPAEQQIDIERETATPTTHSLPRNVWTYLTTAHPLLHHSEDQGGCKPAFIVKYRRQETFVELPAIKGMYFIQPKYPTIINGEGNKCTEVVWGILTVSFAVPNTYLECM